jgi:hypothetical protein
MANFKRTLLCATLLLAQIPAFAQEIPSMAGKFKVPANVVPTTIPLIIDGDGILFEAEMDGPKGSRKFLANLNMGHGFSGYMQRVLEDVGFVRHSEIHLRIGGIPIESAPNISLMMENKDPPARQLLDTGFSSYKLEGVIECGVLQNFDIALDYSQKTLTLGSPGTLPHDGVAVPIKVKPETGVATVEVTVDGKAYPMVIDAGGSYTWIRPSTAAAWLKGHPERDHGTGAVGQANYWMLDVPTEQEGRLIRVADAKIGPMEVANLGVIGTAQRLGAMGAETTEAMYDQYQKNNTPEPVVAWLGANVLKHYRITIDYHAHMSWWQKVSDIDPHELDQVGISLIYDNGVYKIGHVSLVKGKPVAEGVEKGDKIAAIDDKPVQGWSRDQIFTALGGKPGDIHRVTVERAGKTLTLSLPVTAF